MLPFLSSVVYVAILGETINSQRLCINSLHFQCFSCSKESLSGILFSIELGISDVCEKVLESHKEVPTNTTSPYNILLWISLFESQQGSEIRDVISAQRYCNCRSNDKFDLN